MRIHAVKSLATANIFSLAVFAFLLGFAIGEILIAHKLQSKPIALVKDVNEKVPVVSIDGIIDGSLTGIINGNARVFLDGEQIKANASGSFAVPADDLFINKISIRVPDGMKFVASRKGKNYYLVSSSAGEKIVPSNRIYFRNREEAENAGYVPSK